MVRSLWQAPTLQACIQAPYTKGISTSGIIQRCQLAAPVVQSNIHG